MSARHTLVRYTVKPGLEERNEELVRAVYRELDALAPEGFRYATFRLDGGRTFVHVASTEGLDPLSGLTAFAEFLSGIRERCEWGPEVSRAEQVGSFGDQRTWPGQSAATAPTATGAAAGTGEPR